MGALLNEVGNAYGHGQRPGWARGGSHLFPLTHKGEEGEAEYTPAKILVDGKSPAGRQPARGRRR